MSEKREETCLLSLQLRAASPPLLENLVTLSVLGNVCVCIPAGVPLDWMGLAALTCRLRVSMAFIFASQLTHLDLVPMQAVQPTSE